MISDALAYLYPWTKTLHVISIITWMAGLFYLPRLFVYHAENAPVGSDTSEVFKTMEVKLLRLIMNPSMIVTWVLGFALAFTPGVVYWAEDGWFHVKLLAVVAMTAFHMWLARRRKVFLADENEMSGRRYRMMNEVPTLLLLIIIVMVIVKPF